MNGDTARAERAERHWRGLPATEAHDGVFRACDCSRADLIGDDARFVGDVARLWLLSSQAADPPENAIPGAADPPENAIPGGADPPENAIPGAADPPENANPGAADPPENAIPGVSSIRGVVVTDINGTTTVLGVC